MVKVEIYGVRLKLFTFAIQDSIFRTISNFIFLLSGGKNSCVFIHDEILMQFSGVFFYNYLNLINS